MQESHTKLAGWSALFAAVMIIPEAVMAARLDAGLGGGSLLLLGLSGLMLIRVCAGAFALLQFRQLLHELAEYRETDRHISLLIAGGFALWLALTLARYPGLASAQVVMVLLFTIGLPLGFVSIQFGWRLLQANADLAGLKTPFCWTQIIAPLCFITVILAPLGLLILMIGMILLGLILLKAEESIPEFV